MLSAAIKENLITEWQMLSLLMAESIYSTILSNKRIKLLTIGIPNGFSKNLFESVKRNTIGNSFEKESETDVININVYKKSMEDDDIVFLPKKFMFDLSIYSAGKQTVESETLNTNASFDQLLQTIKLADFSTNNSSRANFNKLVGFDEFINDNKRDFISLQEKKNIFRNHIVSDLLKFYIKGISGLTFSEEVFPVKRYQSQNYSTVSLELMRNFLLVLRNLNESQVNNLGTNLFFADPQISDSVKDDVKLLSTAKSFTSSLMEERTVSEKKFERVFTIPIDIDSFTVDRKATSTSFLGKTALSTNDLASKISNRTNDDRTLYKDRSKEPNALIMEEYFVTIEAVV